MNFKIFEKLKLLIIEKDGKKSLYKFLPNGSMIPIFSDQKRLEIYENFGLIVTDDAVYNSSEQKLVDCVNQAVSIEQRYRRYVSIEVLDVEDDFLREVILWDTHIEQVIFQQKCSNVRYAPHFVAYTAASKATVAKRWRVFSLSDRREIMQDEHLWEVEEISDDFLVTSFPGKCCLYSMKKQKLLKDKQLRVVIGKQSNFAMCVSINGNVLVHYNKRWRTFYEAEDFGILSERHQMFYIKRHGKYFIYNYHGYAMFDEVSLQGFDFASFSEKNNVLLLIKDGTPIFLENQE